MSDQERPYTPSEAAKLLGISVASLKYHRLKGHIEGTDVGNTTLYTEAQIQNANLTPEKPGPKPRKRDDDQGDDGRTSSVMFKSRGDTALLVGVAS